MIDHYGRLLVAALGFTTLPRPSSDRALWALRFWLDSWRGIGDVERGMARQGYSPAVSSAATGASLTAVTASVTGLVGEAVGSEVIGRRRLEK